MADKVQPVKHRRMKIPMREKLKQALEKIGGEPLAGSGFENEAPEEGFTSDGESDAPRAPSGTGRRKVPG